MRIHWGILPFHHVISFLYPFCCPAFISTSSAFLILVQIVLEACHFNTVLLTILYEDKYSKYITHYIRISITPFNLIISLPPTNSITLLVISFQLYLRRFNNYQQQCLLKIKYLCLFDGLDYLYLHIILLLRDSLSFEHFAINLGYYW
jgi:hypothetical protein